MSGSCNLWSLKKFTNAYLFQIAQEKSYDYVIIIYMKKYEIAPLTNREALTVHCSVLKHAGSGYSTKEVKGETLDYVSCFYPLLKCSSRFLRALQQNREKSRLLYLFYNKESVKFPTHSFQFSKQTLFPMRRTVSSACSVFS